MDLLANLIAVGFTEYEAKVYLALLRESPASGYQLGKSAGIPRSMVYEALGRLNARGAILKSDERKTTLYRPLPPDVLLNRYEQEHRRLIQSLQESLHALYNAPAEDRFWTMSGRDSILAYVVQTIQEAETELLLVLGDTELAELREEIMQACQRGITVSTILTGRGELNCGQVTRHPPLESKLQELVDVLVVVADKRQALIASTEAVMTATLTNNRHLVLIARQFVWMELFTQRLYKRLGVELLANLDPEDRAIFESFSLGTESRVE
ncbi:MAG: TrmB family transcriptional regulator [Anaerolineales bacterium]|nr:TrmB family transcriptional regulator [Anaerolineales bacterium]